MKPTTARLSDMPGRKYFVYSGQSVLMAFSSLAKVYVSNYRCELFQCASVVCCYRAFGGVTSLVESD
jgi:hypothetical protein